MSYYFESSKPFQVDEVQFVFENGKCIAIGFLDYTMGI